MNAITELKQSPYERLASINVNSYTEKKVNLTYLSWAWAVDQLLRVDPDATWVYSDPVKYGDTMMVFCTVRAFNKPMTAQLPVMDHRNKAIPNPDAFQVNTAMQRCLAKAIALHGLGLYIYAGEDLPESGKAGGDPYGQDGQETANQFKPKSIRLPKLTEEEAAYEYSKWMQVKSLLIDEDGHADQERIVEEWGKLPSNIRTAIKAIGEAMKNEASAKLPVTLAEAS